MNICFTDIVMTMVYIVIGLLILAIIVVFVQSFKNKDKNVLGPRLIYICGVGGLFALIIVALSIIVIGSYNGDLARGVDVSMITLCIAVSAIIPFLVTKALTEMEVTKKIDESIESKIKDTRERLEQAANTAEGKISIYDSDLSRMISFLMIQKTPDRIWSMSWACRSLKSMINAKLADSKTSEREYNDLYIAQCISFISSSLEELRCVDNIEDFFKNYDSTFESYYTMGLATDPKAASNKVTANNTLQRLFRDMLTLYGQLHTCRTKNRLIVAGLFSDEEDPKFVRLEHLAAWFIYSLAKHLSYLADDKGSTVNLPYDFVNKSYVLAKEDRNRLQKALDNAVKSYVTIYEEKMTTECPCFPKIPDSQ